MAHSPSRLTTGCLLLLLSSGTAFAQAAGEPAAPVPAATKSDPPPAVSSLTVDVVGPILIGALMNTFGTFLEYQHRVSSRFSVIGEVTYLASENFRILGGGLTELRMLLAILCFGAAFWFFEPFHGPFVSVRLEAWLATAQNPAGVAAIGNQFDVNLQPGWQWNFHPFTMIAGLSLAYVTGPVRSADGTVAFPLSGFSATPHLRIGAAW